MKKLFFVVTLAASFAGAQSVNVSDVAAEDNTTIEIRKGEKAKLAEKMYEITEGTADIDGDASSLLKEARNNWKKACEDWKKDLVELNKENQVLSRDCGKMTCSTAAMESTCTSQAKYRLKVKIQ